MNLVGLLLAGRYQIQEPIGCGGMADVYRALDMKLNRAVAVKILRNEFANDESFIKRFQQEAMAAASIQNPYVVNVYDVGEDNGVNYIIMELADGITLKEYIRRKGRLDIIESINIAMQIVSGIKDAHAHNIIHRDIKPQNVMVDAQGKAKVMDFGIARAVTAQTITANTVGSVHYISPEQARGSVCDARCDIYSIGITMYEMITGRVPFDGESSVAIALAHIKEPITPPSTYEPLIPVSLEKIIMKCTQKKPELRYSNADELLDDLKKALMTPDLDFVQEKEAVPAIGGTKVFGEKEQEILNSQVADNSFKSKEEEDYQRGIEEEEAQEEKLEDEDEKEGRIEKIVLGIGFAAMAVIFLIVFLLVGKAFHLFGAKDTPVETPTETVIETESESSDETQEEVKYMPAVSGYLLEDAEKILKENEIDDYKIEMKSSDTVEKGYIISVNIDEGAPLREGDQVILTVSSGKDVVPIPESIIDQEQNAAVKALTKLGLSVTIEKEISDSIEAGHVTRCVPSVGEQVSVGSEITLYISEGNGVKQVSVPDLTNKTVDNAKNMLSALNLEGDPQFEYSSTVDANYVIRQEIEAGTKVDENTKITYYISLGVEQVSVPSLIGMTKAEAESALKEKGLVLGDVSSEPRDDYSEGQVCEQGTESGTKVSAGTAVDIVISEGPQKVAVPELRGMTEDEALAELSSCGLVGENGGEEEGSYDAGEVCRTDPEPGSMLEKGSVVRYYLTASEGE